ncbi:MAG TPA: hypothetical protein VK832_01510, partial [Burkholderiaceae bacterium]|nr:hypothetical protein [Burkholderiaceae bacterium]
MALIGSINIGISYQHGLGESSPVQIWLDRNATSYSTDVYDTVLTLKDLNFAYYQFQTKKEIRAGALLDQVELFRGYLIAFEPPTTAGALVSKLPSYRLAMTSSRRYADLIEHWIKNTADREPNAEIADAEAVAAEAMRRLSVEALDQEFKSRDSMKEAIMRSRTMADTAMRIAFLLFGVGGLLLAIVFQQSRAWMVAERARVAFLEQEKTRLEQRVAERTESLNSLMESRRMIIANASHELRTPINALRL